MATKKTSNADASEEKINKTEAEPKKTAQPAKKAASSHAKKTTAQPAEKATSRAPRAKKETTPSAEKETEEKTTEEKTQEPAQEEKAEAEKKETVEAVVDTEEEKTTEATEAVEKAPDEATKEVNTAETASEQESGEKENEASGDTVTAEEVLKAAEREYNLAERAALTAEKAKERAEKALKAAESRAEKASEETRADALDAVSEAKANLEAAEQAAQDAKKTQVEKALDAAKIAEQISAEKKVKALETAAESEKAVAFAETQKQAAIEKADTLKEEARLAAESELSKEAQDEKTAAAKAADAERAQAVKAYAQQVKEGRRKTDKANREAERAVSVADAKAEKAESLTFTPDPKYLLQVRHLRKYFPIKKDFFGRPTANLRAVDDVSFDLERGKTLGIVGESGCGKTTMGRTILKLYQPTGGDVYFDGTNIAPLSQAKVRPLRTRMQIIFQDPYSSLPPRMPVGSIIGEAVKVHKIVPKSELHSYILNIMDKCGLRDYYFERYPHEFSGGQRQRICIARALAVNPQLIVCDEPVSALDVSIQAQIINLLKDLQQSMGLTYLFISHDLSVVKHISDNVGVMYLGSMVEFGSNKSIFSNPMHPYTRALFSAVPVPDPKVKMNRIILSGDIPSPANPPSGCKFHTRCPACMDICKEKEPVYREYEKGHFVACHLWPQE